jgi:hypothetical protein
MRRRGPVDCKAKRKKLLALQISKSRYMIYIYINPNTYIYGQLACAEENIMTLENIIM